MTFTDRLRAGVSDHRPNDVAAGVECERCERAQFSPSKRLVAFTPELCLDCPVFLVTVEGYQAKDGSSTGTATTVKLPDGTSLFAGSTAPGGPGTTGTGGQTRAVRQFDCGGSAGA